MRVPLAQFRVIWPRNARAGFTAITTSLAVGEKISNAAQLGEWLSWEAQAPIPAFVQTRQVQVNEDTCVIDTVGAVQFGLRDIQAVLPADYPEKDACENFALNLLSYCVGTDRMPFKSGDSIPNGPGGRWHISLTNAALIPPRDVADLCPDELLAQRTRIDES